MMAKTYQHGGGVAQRWTRLFAAALLLALLLGGATPAFAEEGDNAVNPQQLPDSSFIYDTSLADLNTADAYFDGQTVQVTGEAVGDNLHAGINDRHRWITLSSPDNTATLSVYMTAESAGQIDTFGAYGSTGTTVQVRGTYHLVCEDHEGISDLHAEVVTVVSPGEQHTDRLDLNAFIPGAVAVVVGLLMVFAFYYLRERQR